jgi:hypothetical protein
MKKSMKTRRVMFGLAAAGSALCLTQPQPATAEVSDADFKSLQETVARLAEQMQSLQQTNQIMQQVHQQDQQQLQQLQEKLAATQQTAADTEQKVAAATTSQTQPLPRVPIDETTVNHNFMMLGDAEVQYAKPSGQNGSFYMADFAPVFLYRGGDNVLFEAGFDTTLANNAPNTNSNSGYTTTFNLTFAQLDYVMTDYLTLSAGEMLLPLGTYSERGAGWLNKIPNDPLARDLLPSTGVGAQLRGAVPLGESGRILNYSVYGVNGPASIDGTGTASQLDVGGNVGPNLHPDPAGGGRLGIFLPFKPHYDLELGVSAIAGEWDSAGQHLYTAGVFDASLHLGSSFELKGEYIGTRFGSDDLGRVNQNGWWTQAGYKLAGLNTDLPVINNLELVGRYETFHDGMGTSTRRYTVGYVYYITSAFLFEGDYQFLHSTDPSQVDQLIFQLSYGF